MRLTIQGRECTIDVADVPNDCPVLIGQIPLEMLDFVVDLRKQKLLGNPEHLEARVDSPAGRLLKQSAVAISERLGYRAPT